VGVIHANRGGGPWRVSDRACSHSPPPGEKKHNPRRFGFFGLVENYKKTNCSLKTSKRIIRNKITQTNVNKLLNREPTNVIKGFKKGEKTFDAKLRYEKDKIQFVF